MTDQELHEKIIGWEDEVDSLEDELENAQSHLNRLYELRDSRRSEMTTERILTHARRIEGDGE